MVVIKSKIEVESRGTVLRPETYHIIGKIDDREFCIEYVPRFEIWNDVNHTLKGGVDIRKIKNHYFEQCIKLNNDGTPFYWEKDV